MVIFGFKRKRKLETPSAISVLIADSQTIFAEGLKTLIEKTPGFAVSQMCHTPEQTLLAVSESTPDILVLAYDMRTDFSENLLQQLKELAPQMPVMAICGHTTKENADSLRAAGVQCILSKDCAREEVIKALYTCYWGRKYFCARIMEVVANDKADGLCDVCTTPCLSGREMEIMKLVAEGGATRKIAEKLELSIFTVHTHRRNILRKLGLRNTTELALYAVKEGIIQP